MLRFLSATMPSCAIISPARPMLLLPRNIRRNVEADPCDAEAAKNSSDKGMVMKKETLNEETEKTTTVVSGIVVGVIVIVAFATLAILIRRRRKIYG